VHPVDLVRVDFALIPGNPLFDAVITASQAITDEFRYNANVIDARIFPPHLSLHICTIPRAAITQVTATLKPLAKGRLPGLSPAGIQPSGGGYIMLAIERSPALMSLHEAVLGAAAQARDGLGDDPFGSPYVRDSFTPHISLAKTRPRRPGQSCRHRQPGPGQRQQHTPPSAGTLRHRCQQRTMGHPRHLPRHPPVSWVDWSLSAS
jgi:hypothetical protein